MIYLIHCPRLQELSSLALRSFELLLPLENRPPANESLSARSLSRFNPDPTAAPLLLDGPAGWSTRILGNFMPLLVAPPLIAVLSSMVTAILLIYYTAAKFSNFHLS
jgi:hypothetical protein